MKKMCFIIFIILFVINVFGIETNISNYHINVTLDDSLKTLNGYEDIVYINNSNDTLSSIVFHLYANMFKSGSEYLKKCNKTANNKTEGFIVIDSIIIGNDNHLSGEEDYTLYTLLLSNPLLPKDSLSLRVFFRHKIPKLFLREGFSDMGYDISQWYPKIAVYNNGKWSDFQAYRFSEYFGEYGDYHITLTMNDKYYAFGSGDIIGPESEIERIKEIRELGICKEDTSSNFKTIEMAVSNVNDFAFILRSNFNIIYNDESKPIIEIVCSKSMVELFEEQVENVENMFKFYSDKYIEYPYDKITIAEGLLNAGGGMEYPRFTIISPEIVSADKIPFVSTYLLEDVICHEIAHQWFYLIIGSDEAEEPFMDEAFAVFSELSYMESKYGKHGNYVFLFNKPVISLFNQHYLLYSIQQIDKESTPMNTPSYEYEKMQNYGTNVYSKGFLCVRAIEHMIGEEKFRKIIKQYFEKYAFSHPTMQDLFEFLNEKTDNMYYIELRNILYENVYTDYRIKGVKNFNNDYEITIANSSPFEFPIEIQFMFKDGTDSIIRKSVDENTIQMKGKEISNIIIDPKQKYLDLNYYDNIKRSHFTFHFLDFETDYFANNVYAYPWIEHSLIDRFSYGGEVYICDKPTLKLNGIGTYGKFGLKIFTGYNPDNGILYKHLMESYQGNDVKTGFIHMFKYSENIYSINNTLTAFKSKLDGNSFALNIYSRYAINNGDQYFLSRMGTSKLSILGFDYLYHGKKSFINYYAKTCVEFSDDIIYSNTEFQRILLKSGIFVEKKNSQIGIGYQAGIEYSGGIVWGDKNGYSGMYLYSNPLKLFSEKSMFENNYPMSIDYTNGFGYQTDDRIAYGSIHRFRFSAGTMILRPYFDFYMSGDDYTIDTYNYQAGMQLRFGNIINIEIPFYNDTNGFMIMDGISINLSSEIIK